MVLYFKQENEGRKILSFGFVNSLTTDVVRVNGYPEAVLA